MTGRAHRPQGSGSGMTRALVVNVVYAAVLASLSIMSSPPYVPVFSRADWLSHGLAYLVQTLLLYSLFRWMTTPSSAIVAAAATAALFGTVMEVAQLVMPGRFFELPDLLANVTGIGFGLALLVGYRMWWPTRSEGASR